MQITGMKYGQKILQLAGFPIPTILCNNAYSEDIDALIKKRGRVVVKPVFYGGVGKKGKAGLIKIVDNVPDALEARRQLFFAKHKFHGHSVVANGATFEEFIPSDYEIYFNISVSTQSRMVSFTLSIDGGIDIEELPPDRIVMKSFDPLTGLKTYHIIDALAELNAPSEIISPLARYLPALWELYNDYGFDVMEINPIRMSKVGKRYVPYACDFKAMLDQDNPQTKRLNLPDDVFESSLSEFEMEVNALRTYQGQSDVAVINPKGTITPFMFGGGANSAATEILSDRTTISTDFGGNPPFEKMYNIAEIVYKYWIKNSNVILVIGGKANNTDIFVTLKAIVDALRDYISEHGKQDIYVVIGRGGPNLIKGMAYAHDMLNNLKIPHRFFGYDSSMVDVIQYAVDVDDWMKARQ
ncbi:MAG TPA: carboxylate--amine ligase [Saprospiraceae bacterium]|nr:carboxylate--amine ligase [Saprospiraceae bacterium]